MKQGEGKQEFDCSVDVLVVGSGSGGFAAAIAAADGGSNTLLIESTELLGGCSSMSGGGLWIPNNSLMQEAGVADPPDEVRAYLDEIIGDVGPASSGERRAAFLVEGPKMVDYLRNLGVKFNYAKGYPDYYPQKFGGLAEGRCIDGGIYNLNELPKEWRKKLRGLLPMAITTKDASVIAKPFSKAGMGTLGAIIGKRMIGGKLTGKNYAGLGVALVGQLLKVALQKGVDIWLESPLAELILEEGRVVGAIVIKEGKPLRVEAKKGVIMAAGGFAQNNEMRQKYHPKPICTDWTSANPGDLGGGITAGMSIGSETALMDDAWWGPTLINPNGEAQFMIWERSNPFSIMVDAKGNRFMNESASYVDCGHWMYEHNEKAPCIPAYMIIDSNHRKKYMLGMMMPGSTPKSAFTSGFITKGSTIEELAQAVGIDAENLKATIERFNGFCSTGVDEDFERGSNAYDRYYSDAKEAKPNPNLGAIAAPPFYALKVWPGDLSTKGGLLTDEFARVISTSGEVIEGLYAAGNNSASIMGRTYPGAGATIGPAMTFGYIAGKHAAGAAL